MSPPREIIETLAHIEAFERVPLEDRMEAWTIHQLVARGAAIDPHNAAIHYIIDGDPEEDPLTITYGQLMTRVNQTANLLHRLSGGARVVIGVLLPMVPENYLMLCAGPTAGILAPVNWMLEPSAIAGIFAAAGVKTLVALGPTPGFEIWPKALQVRRLLGGTVRLIQVQGPGGTVEEDLDFRRLMEAEPGDALAFDERPAPDDVAIYCPTGGTTGAPKLAPLTHRAIAYKCHVYGWVLGFEPSDIIFAGTPLFHSGGIVNRTLSPLFQGMTNVILSPHGFRNKNIVKNFWKLVERFKATELVAVPTVLSALANSPPVDEDVSSLKPYANTGSAGMPGGLTRKIEEVIGVCILANYGLTENTASAAAAPRAGAPRYGASGMRLPYTQIKTVVVENGAIKRQCGPDEIGVITIKGPGVISGYVDSRLDKDLFFEDGWLNTGDLGRIDEDGFIWVTGRVKDLIIRGGNNLDAKMIDETLLEHPAVELAAAVGKPDAYAGELPVAYVQLKAGASATAEEIKDFARAHVAERAAAPTEIFIVDPMPLTEVGKILKPALRLDAAHRVFSGLLQPLAVEGVALGVSVGEDALLGSLATVTLEADSGARADEVEREIHRLLGVFAMPHKVVPA